MKICDVALESLAWFSFDAEDVLADNQGRKYAQIINSVDFPAWVLFFSDPLRQQRMKDAEEHFNYPALGGVLKELESSPIFAIFRALPRHETKRHRQLVGVLTRIVMEGLGWHKQGRKGALTTLSKVFLKSERYAKSREGC